MFTLSGKKILLRAASLAALSAVAIAGICSPAMAQQADEEISFWEKGSERIGDIVDEGRQSILLSGYARHGRGTYSSERLKELNEDAWGFGVAKTRRNAKDNEEIVYALGIEDSHYKPQLMAGYAYQWTRPLSGKWEIAGGYTAMFMSRQDYFGGMPFPIALPLASIGTRDTKLMASYVPRLSKNKGNGDVLLLFMRFDLP